MFLHPPEFLKNDSIRKQGFFPDKGTPLALGKRDNLVVVANSCLTLPKFDIVSPENGGPLGHSEPGRTLHLPT